MIKQCFDDAHILGYECQSFICDTYSDIFILKIVKQIEFSKCLRIVQFLYKKINFLILSVMSLNYFPVTHAVNNLLDQATKT